MRTSRLPHGAHFDGRIRGQGDLIIAGEVDGPIEIDGQLTIEATGVVRGDIRARSIAIAGQVEGNAHAIELIRLEPGAKMIGDARAERVSAGTGALLRGRIRTSTERAQNERMRRTSGGTLLAPFSSSGGIAAPILNDSPLRMATLPGYFVPVEVEALKLELAVEHAPERIAERAVERAPERIAERAPERMAERVVERAPERVVERDPERVVERAPERALEAKLVLPQAEVKAPELKADFAKESARDDARETRSSATPPRPLMPVIGRQKAVRRPEGST